MPLRTLGSLVVLLAIALALAPRMAGAEPSLNEARGFWSFRPLADPEIPEVQQRDWPQNEIDYFILAKLEEAGIEPVEVADRRTLIRRATFDLLGLPPTPAEIDAFVNDSAPLEEALRKVVERLLASPHYGQRWGRHWMDLVRYADTAGDNSDYPIPQLYLYRNYIIDSFNGDKPYDQFVREQLAGDLLDWSTAEQRKEQLIATGYIALARRFGSVVVDYPQHLTIEDTLDNLGRTFLGLTVTCARCHDHKFDAISQEDYYGLYGIFASTRYAFPGIELDKVPKDFVPLIPQEQVEKLLEPHRQRERELKERGEQFEQKQKELEQQKKQLQQQASTTGEAGEPQGKNLQRQIADLDEELKQVKAQLQDAQQALEKHRSSPPDYPRAYAVQDGQVAEAHIHMRGDPEQTGAKIDRKFLDLLGGQRLSDGASKTSGRLQLAEWIVDPQNPLTARVMVNRIWQYHFGRGLVETPSDFGTRGTPPTHPELLDLLARRFMSEGWSVKQMHRLIMASKTYQLASCQETIDRIASASSRQAIDPDNKLYWRFNRRRLDAESLRDAILAISGNLDPTPLMEPHPFPPIDSWEFTQHHPFKEEYPSNRRSVYLMTRRLTANTFFTTFDGPDRNATTPRRDSSVTTSQALYLLNSQFIHEQSAAFASRLLQQQPQEAARIALAFELALGRPPSAEEQRLVEQFLAELRRRLTSAAVPSQQHEQLAWESFARSLFRLNDFLYVD